MNKCRPSKINMNKSIPSRLWESASKRVDLLLEQVKGKTILQLALSPVLEIRLLLDAVLALFQVLLAILPRNFSAVEAVIDLALGPVIVFFGIVHFKTLHIRCPIPVAQKRVSIMKGVALNRVELVLLIFLLDLGCGHIVF